MAIFMNLLYANEDLLYIYIYDLTFVYANAVLLMMATTDSGDDP